jgi:hypothetical protein
MASIAPAAPRAKPAATVTTKAEAAPGFTTSTPAPMPGNAPASWASPYLAVKGPPAEAAAYGFTPDVTADPEAAETPAAETETPAAEAPAETPAPATVEAKPADPLAAERAALDAKLREVDAYLDGLRKGQPAAKPADEAPAIDWGEGEDDDGVKRKFSDADVAPQVKNAFLAQQKTIKKLEAEVARLAEARQQTEADRNAANVDRLMDGLGHKLLGTGRITALPPAQAALRNAVLQEALRDKSGLAPADKIKAAADRVLGPLAPSEAKAEAKVDPTAAWAAGHTAVPTDRRPAAGGSAVHDLYRKFKVEDGEV